MMIESTDWWHTLIALPWSSKQALPIENKKVIFLIMNKRTKSDHLDMNFWKLSIFNYDLYISVRKDFKFQFEIHNRILFFSACLILLK